MANDHPFAAFRFTVELSGIAVAGFSEVSGLSTEITMIEYRSGNDLQTRKIPGMVKVSDVTLKRGMTSNTGLYDWYKSVASGQHDPRDVAITLLGEDGSPVARWLLFSVWPRKLSWSTLNAAGNEVAIEELVLACERLELDKG